jgi:hypothetical protein
MTAKNGDAFVSHSTKDDTWTSRNDGDLDEAERLFYAVLGRVPDDPRR